MKLSEMYEKRKALSGEIDALTNGTVKLDATNESRAAAMLDELDNMDSEIRRVGLRDRLDGGGVTSNVETGRPAASHKTEFRTGLQAVSVTITNLKCELRAYRISAQQPQSPVHFSRK